jgi:glycosyltransferase involved in cell wall biosynthesis
MNETLPILIPVYNEQSYLTRIVERVLAAPVPNDMKKELVIVNDASKDKTSEVIRDLCAKHPEIKAFDQPVNMGIPSQRGFIVQRIRDRLAEPTFRQDRRIALAFAAQIKDRIQ